MQNRLSTDVHDGWLIKARYTRIGMVLPFSVGRPPSTPPRPWPTRWGDGSRKAGPYRSSFTNTVEPEGHSTFYPKLPRNREIELQASIRQTTVHYARFEPISLWRRCSLPQASSVSLRKAVHMEGSIDFNLPC